MKALVLSEGNLKEREIENTLESLQEIVGGWIEIPFLSERFAEEEIDVVINEEGKLIGLEPQIAIFKKDTKQLLDLIMGNCIFVSHDEEGNTIGLNDKQISVVKEELKMNILTSNMLTLKALFV